MKRILLIFIILFCLNQSSFSQGAEYNDVYPADVINPKFNEGGLDKFYEYVNKNFDFSKATKEGKMITSFSLNELGEIKNIRVVQFVDVESATEIIRVLKTTPKWEPAQRGGRPFSVSIKFPLTFKQKENPINFASPIKKETQGGLNHFFNFIKTNYRMPDVPGLKGEIIISFTINEDGTLSDFKAVHDLGYGSFQEAIRVLKLTSGKWTPAEQKGKKVKTTYTLPIKIDIPEE